MEKGLSHSVLLACPYNQTGSDVERGFQKLSDHQTCSSNETYMPLHTTVRSHSQGATEHLSACSCMYNKERLGTHCRLPTPCSV